MKMALPLNSVLDPSVAYQIWLPELDADIPEQPLADTDEYIGNQVSLGTPLTNPLLLQDAYEPQLWKTEGNPYHLSLAPSEQVQPSIPGKGYNITLTNKDKKLELRVSAQELAGLLIIFNYIDNDEVYQHLKVKPSLTVKDTLDSENTVKSQVFSRFNTSFGCTSELLNVKRSTYGLKIGVVQSSLPLSVEFPDPSLDLSPCPTLDQLINDLPRILADKVFTVLWVEHDRTGYFKFHNLRAWQLMQAIAIWLSFDLSSIAMGLWYGRELVWPKVK